MNDNYQHVKWFRDSSPYINAHRGKIFVIYISGDAIEHHNFANIIADIVLLNSLGVKLILVHGATPQINTYLADQSIKYTNLSEVRITSPEILPAVLQVIGKIKIDLEAALSKGVINAPLHAADINVSSGNYIKAKPLGIIEGVDFHNTGTVRKVNTQLMRKQLEQQAVILISPTGYSPSGEIFNIVSGEVACEVACAIKADKLILFGANKGIFDQQSQLINELQVTDINPAGLSPVDPLIFARRACLSGVARSHLISFSQDGALLEELFTRDGAGTQVSQLSYEQIRIANVDDVAGIIELIQPLEQQGVLVKRSRELIESEISQFVVIERDGMIISCGALYPFERQAELACLATHPDYRHKKRGDKILRALEQKAKQLALQRLFVLTTHTAHWFTERGFKQSDLAQLPESRVSLYNYQRNSKLFIKPLTE
ncbi:MAG: amino-acid N-acetyltransferase [Pseudomonadales bacterium]|nr:amino-acid N-acetyltransferase [Pseudomonadales bacterium]